MKIRSHSSGEGSPGVSGNKGTIILGTREQKENKAGNTGKKAVFREQGTLKSKKKMLLGNKALSGTVQ